MAQTGYTPILLYSSTTAAQAPAAGNLTNSTFGSELAINITDGKLFYKDNANAVQVIAWKTTPTTAGGTGLTSYTAGDLPYYATGTTLSKLSIGSNGQVLTSTGTAPQWTTLSGVAVTTFNAGTTGFTPNSATSGAVTLAGTLITSNGGTGLSSYTAGDLTYYASGTTLTKLAIGASTTILTSTGTAPQWSTASGITVGTATNLAGGVAGSVPYQSAAGTTTFLAIGTANRVMTSTGSAPQWVTSLTLAGNSSFNGVSIGTGNVSGAATSVAVGFGALANYTGNYGTAVGYEAANATFSSNGIAAFGYRACAASTSGSNAGFGRQALEAEASGAANLAVGHYAGYLINGGSNNCIVGYSAVTAAGTQSQLTAVGTNALTANTGSNNTAIGYNAGSTATSGNNNGFFGNGAAPSSVTVSDEYTYGNSSVTSHRFVGGNVSVLAGNLIIGTSGKGIDFSATAGTGTSELLADYEEGTWTPTMTSASGTTTVNAVSGRYTKIGDHTFVVFEIDYSTNASVGTSTFTISGLPFTSRSSFSSRGFVTSSNWSGSDYNDGYMTIGSAVTTIVWAGRSVDQSNRTNAILRFCADYFTG